MPRGRKQPDGGVGRPAEQAGMLPWEIDLVSRMSGVQSEVSREVGAAPAEIAIYQLCRESFALLWKELQTATKKLDRL